MNDVFFIVCHVVQFHVSDLCRFEGDFDEPEVPDEVLSNATFVMTVNMETMAQCRWRGFPVSSL